MAVDLDFLSFVALRLFGHPMRRNPFALPLDIDHLGKETTY
jgi:hypothetical protein